MSKNSNNLKKQLSWRFFKSVPHIFSYSAANNEYFPKTFPGVTPDNSADTIMDTDF